MSNTGLTGIHTKVDVIHRDAWASPLREYLDADEEYAIQKRFADSLDESSIIKDSQMIRAKRLEAEKQEKLDTFLQANTQSVLSVLKERRNPVTGARIEEYSRWEAYKKRKGYKKARKAGKTYDLDLQKLRLSPYYESMMKEKVSDCDDPHVTTQRQLYEECMAGRFNDFEKLDPIFRDTLAAEYTQSKMSVLVKEGLTDEEIVDRLEKVLGFEGLAHPLLRLGISLGMRGQVNYGAELDATRCANLDELFNTRIMRNTLIATRDSVEDTALRQQLGKDYQSAVDREAYSKKFMMKTLLLGHLGLFEKVEGKDKTETRTEWDHTVASAFTHCSRVLFTLPSEYGRTAQEKPDVEAFRLAYMGKSKGYDSKSGFVRRAAATHRASAGDSTSKASEKKMSGGWLLHQAGLNVAIGGLGKKGISGRMLLNDGSCGHIYRYYRETGHAGTGHGVMLLGFESDAHEKKNQLGHIHGTGNPEYCSSFGGQRVDEIGNKYGGRVVDASGINLQLATEMFKAIDRIVDNADGLPDSQQKERMKGLADLLTGNLIQKGSATGDLDYTNVDKLMDILFSDIKTQNPGLFMNYKFAFANARVNDSFSQS